MKVKTASGRHGVAKPDFVRLFEVWIMSVSNSESMAVVHSDWS